MHELLIKRLAGLVGGIGAGAIAGGQTASGWAAGAAQPEAWGLAVAGVVWLLMMWVAERAWTAAVAWQRAFESSGVLACLVPLAIAWRTVSAVQASAGRAGDYGHVATAGVAAGGGLMVVSWALIGICGGIALIAIGRTIGRHGRPAE